MATSSFAIRQFYKRLQVSPSATQAEIKQAYRSKALEIHPDRHQGCPDKQIQFQELTEAYEYLVKHAPGGRGRETAPNDARRTRTYNVNYRKVYAPRPPPEWKFVWDHEEHREMHYGDGFQRKVMHEHARKLEYHSPLGKGFSFSSTNDGGAASNVNPYAKHAPQGPPKAQVDYEEIDYDGRKAHIRHQERIVQDMTSRRIERRKRGQYTGQPHVNPMFVGSKRYGHVTDMDTKGGDCAIL